jgi:hypothetical protein
LNFVATYNIRSPKRNSEKKIVLWSKGDDITRFDGSKKLKNAWVKGDIHFTYYDTNDPGKNFFFINLQTGKIIYLLKNITQKTKSQG